MSRVSVSELKANLSRYLREVRRGGEVQVLHRGVPVARLTKVASDVARQDKRREHLIRSGVLRPGKGDADQLLVEPPLELDVDLLEAILDERSDRL